MHFIGSTTFAYETVAARDTSREAADLKRQDSNSFSQQLTEAVQIFIDYGLPALVHASAGHSLEHYVFCGLSVPENILTDLQNAVAEHPFITFASIDDVNEPYQLPVPGDRTDGGSEALFWLHPRDVTPKSFFDSFSRYTGPEYSGMDLVLTHEPTGWLTENNQLMLAPNNQSFDKRNAIRFRRSTHQATLAPLPPMINGASRRAVVADGSGVGRLRLYTGRTVALWREPNQTEFPWNDVSQVMRNAAQEEFSELADSVVFERQFDLSFEPIDQGVWAARFPFPTRGFTLDLRLRSDQSAANGLYVGYDLIDAEGAPISPDAEIEGIGRSSNPEIGHCFASDIESGESRIVRHIRTPSGVLCQGLKVTQKVRGELHIDEASVSFKMKEID